MKTVELKPVKATEHNELIALIEALYVQQDQHGDMKNIKAGVESLLRSERLGTAYFIRHGSDRIGYVILTRYHSVKRGGLVIFIDELFVDPKKRRKRVGHQMMQAILEVARSEKAKSLWAQAEPYNEAARAFFTSEGFSPDTRISFERPI